MGSMLEKRVQGVPRTRRSSRTQGPLRRAVPTEERQEQESGMPNVTMHNDGLV